MICNKCGKEMKMYIKGSEQCWECRECGAKAVTTYINPIKEDMTEYVITIEKDNVVNKNTVSILMKYTGLSPIQVSNIIKNQCPYKLVKGRALEIKEVSKILDEKEIAYSITPEFRW